MHTPLLRLVKLSWKKCWCEENDESNESYKSILFDDMDDISAKEISTLRAAEDDLPFAPIRNYL